LFELKLDCPYPENAVIIDHHDSRAGKDQLTAIEQTAQRLDVQMNSPQFQKVTKIQYQTKKIE
jgi:hypothetical protein